jgi:hypothetical protein
MYLYDSLQLTPQTQLDEPLATAPPLSPARQSPMVRIANALVAPYGWIRRIVARSYDKPETEYSIGTGLLISPSEKIWCDAGNKVCQVDYSTGIGVGVSFVHLPGYVIARRIPHPTGPRCEYDFDCRPSGELVLRKRRCGPS